jgi:glycosyltransferase involved in cell wall biosynthesis
MTGAECRAESPRTSCAKVRVAHVVDCFGAGGIAAGVRALIELTGDVIDHSVISLSDDVRLADSLDPRPPVHVIKPGPTRLAGFTGRLARLARRSRCQIVHTNNQFAWLDAGLASALSGSRCIVTFHGVERPISEFGGFARWKCRSAARLGCAVTAVGEASRRMVCELGGIPEESVEVIPNGVDLDRFRPRCPGDQRRPALRDQLAIGPDVDLVVHVAGLRPVKDQRTLLHAWQLVTESRNRLSGREPLLLIVGEGECRDDLHTLAEELQITRTVRFLGQRRDPEELLPACDVFVLSSLSEGLSFAILEAMACGLPVVATRVGGNIELVEDGVTGILAPSCDPAALAVAVGRLLDDGGQRLRMGERGRDFVERHHDAAAWARRYVELYRTIAAGMSRGNPRAERDRSSLRIAP